MSAFNAENPAAGRAVAHGSVSSRAPLPRKVGPALVLIALCLGGCERRSLNLAAPDVAFCISRGQWPHLLMTMNRFASERGLTINGGVDPPLAKHDAPHLNAALVQGRTRYWGIDDLDLWVTSVAANPDPELIYVSAVTKRPATSQQQKIARDFLARLGELGPAAQGPKEDPICPRNQR